MATLTSTRRERQHGQVPPGRPQAQLGPFPLRRARPARAAGQSPKAKWLGRAFVAAGLGMVPWLGVLWARLPASTTVVHWSTAWAGLDAMEAAGLAATGVLLLRRDDRCCLTAAATSALILTDAWFDTATALPGNERLTAILMAACIEVPVSLGCAALAVRTLRHGTFACARNG